MIALVVILAAALGAAVTVIVILLFLRSRATGHQPGSADRQITEAEVRVEIFRELQQLTGPPDSITRAGGDPPRQAAVHGATPAHPPHALPGVICSRRHLSVLKGGALSAVILTVSGFLREAHQAQRGHIAAALVSAGATATSVTLLTVTPWIGAADAESPSSAPLSTASAAHSPPPTMTAPTRASPTSHSPSQSPATAQPSSTLSAASPSPSASPSPEPTSSVAVVADEPPPSAQETTGGTPPDTPEGTGPSESPPSSPDAPTPLPPETPSASDLCLSSGEPEPCLPDG